jgi:hypothetical protein
MRRRPHSAISIEPPAAPAVPTTFDFTKWANAEEAALILRKFRRKDGKPSVGAIRNMVYRGQIVAHKLFGRLLFLREELDRLVVMAPLTRGA